MPRAECDGGPDEARAARPGAAWAEAGGRACANLYWEQKSHSLMTQGL